MAVQQKDEDDRDEGKARCIGLGMNTEEMYFSGEGEITFRMSMAEKKKGNM